MAFRQSVRSLMCDSWLLYCSTGESAENSWQRGNCWRTDCRKLNFSSFLPSTSLGMNFFSVEVIFTQLCACWRHLGCCKLIKMSIIKHTQAINRRMRSHIVSTGGNSFRGDKDVVLRWELAFVKQLSFFAILHFKKSSFERQRQTKSLLLEFFAEFQITYSDYSGIKAIFHKKHPFTFISIPITHHL